MYKSVLPGIALTLSASVLMADPLEPMVVTAARMEMPVADTLAPVIVINRDQIERSLAADVAELLRFHAGLELGRNGGPGQATSLFIRGTESNHALVLIDGIEINPGTIGGAALQNISPRHIERIEIVKGPRSSLYGSEAIGGVINIITRESEGFAAQAGVGAYNSRELSLSGGYKRDSAGLSASVSQNSTDGFATRTEPGLPDRGFDNLSVGLNGHLNVGRMQVSLRHWQSEGETEYLDFFLQPLDQDYRNRATALRFDIAAGSGWDSAITVSQIVDDIDQNQGPDFATTTRNVIDWHNTYAVGQRHRLAAGLYLASEDTKAESFGTVFKESSDASALYLQDHIDWDRNTLLIAARFGDNDSFGNNTTYNAEFGHDLSDSLRLSVAAGTGFRAPDATDRFGFGGNPALEAETSRNLELGLRGRWNAQHSTGLQLFRNDIEDLIEFVFDPVTFGGVNLNVARATIRGAELRHDWQQGPWQMNVSGIALDPKDRNSGQQLARRAKRTLTVNLAREFGDHSIGLDVLATSTRRDSPFSDDVNAGYVLANLSGQFALTPRWNVSARLENLLDTDYETAAGFASAGRGLYIGAQYRAR